MSFATIEHALTAIRSGEFVVVVDDHGRENEGDLIISAQCATPEATGFMVRYTSGVICVALEPERVDALQLPPMVPNNADPHGTAFTVSVDLKHGTTTGISAADRSATIRALADGERGPEDFARPGHVFPLRYAPGGVLRRPGHTEAAVDLARLAGHPGAGALSEIVNDDGSMARLPELRSFAAHHGFLVVNIADLVAYRLRTEAWSQPLTAATARERNSPPGAYGRTSH
ncbi:MAG: 3,4-dihydroxy-2-butanone-4-phosphate synthase [Polyangiales bacterium]